MSTSPSEVTGAPALTRRQSIARPIVAQRRYLLVLMLLAPAIFLALTNSDFRQPGNLSNVLQQASIVGVIAVGQTVVLILGGFDLSVGAVAALAGVVALAVFGDGGGPALIAVGIVAAVAAGGVVGAANGMLTGRLGINPLIATLGMQSLVRGLVLILTAGELIVARGDATQFSDIALGKVAGIPISGIVFLVIAVVVWVVLKHTTFGQYVFAVGGSERASRLSGVPVLGVKVVGYGICALLAAVGGVLLASRTASALPNAGLNYELQAITAAVVGGARLSGGRGSIWGTVLGVLMLATVANGLNLYGVSPYWQSAVTGAILLVAVGVGALSSSEERG